MSQISAKAYPNEPRQKERSRSVKKGRVERDTEANKRESIRGYTAGAGEIIFGGHGRSRCERSLPRGPAFTGTKIRR